MEVRSSGKPTANAVAFRRPLPRMGPFAVGFMSDYTFHEERPATVPVWNSWYGIWHYRFCTAVTGCYER
jgi:hypothetical protein